MDSVRDLGTQLRSMFLFLDLLLFLGKSVEDLAVIWSIGSSWSIV